MRRWYHLGMGLGLVVLLGGCTSERDRVAPIVIPDVVVSICALSPAHHYLLAQTYDPERLPNQDAHWVQIFDLATTHAITIPIPAVDITRPTGMEWYPEERILLDQRWLYDIPHGIVTDTTTLPTPLPPTPYQVDVPQWNPSPDGRYVANGSQIWERNPMTGEPDTLVVDLPSTPYTTGCTNAWSADSRSYYFVDWETVGPRQAQPGPIRKITLP